VEANPLGLTDPTGENPGLARIIVAVGVAARNACLRLKGCKKALEEAEKFCKEVKCELKRERADHNFGDKKNKRYCEHYRLTCWTPGRGQVFSTQIALPGRCFDEPKKNLGEN